jgi:hypothetical protein
MRAVGRSQEPSSRAAIDCTDVEAGSLRVREVWDSREKTDAFGERLMPVLDEVGIDPGEPEFLEIHKIIRR